MRRQIQELEADLEACKKMRMEAEGNVSMLRGKLRELEGHGRRSKGAIAVPVAAVTAAKTSSALHLLHRFIDRYFCRQAQTNSDDRRYWTKNGRDIK
ncbi:MAG: hypothetical protein IPO92_07295 [Saprospiraceae bacterium]|nr:hypothetical protein [Saprospiraceae bacterium]